MNVHPKAWSCLLVYCDPDSWPEPGEVAVLNRDWPVVAGVHPKRAAKLDDYYFSKMEKPNSQFLKKRSQLKTRQQTPPTLKQTAKSERSSGVKRASIWACVKRSPLRVHFGKDSQDGSYEWRIIGRWWLIICAGSCFHWDSCFSIWSIGAIMEIRPWRTKYDKRIIEESTYKLYLCRQIH